MRWSLNAPLFFLSDLCRRIGSSLVSKESKTPKPKRRWLRRSLWLCLVLAMLGVAAIGYLNQVGMPDFAKRAWQNRASRPGSGNQSPPLPASPIQGTTITNVSAIDAWAWEFWILSTPTKSRSYGKGQTKKTAEHSNSTAQVSTPAQPSWLRR